MKKIVIVNKQDEIIGHKARTDVTFDDIYRVSALWILNTKGEVLLAQRAYTKSHNPGQWGPAVAGTVEQGETYIDNIKKEAFEELGLVLADVDLEKGSKEFLNIDHTYWAQSYIVTLDKEVGYFTLQEEEVAEVAWFNIEDLLQLIEKRPQKFLPKFEIGVKRFQDFLSIKSQ